jgi:hypothetical protein
MRRAEAELNPSRFGTCERYRLSADLTLCDCPDHCFREERPGSKNVVGLRAALLAITTPDTSAAVASAFVPVPVLLLV